MLVVLSPAKTLDLGETSVSASVTEPEGQSNADYLAAELAKLDAAGLKSLLEISADLAR